MAGKDEKGAVDSAKKKPIMPLWEWFFWFMAALIVAAGVAFVAAPAGAAALLASIGVTGVLAATVMGMGIVAAPAIVLMAGFTWLIRRYSRGEIPLLWSMLRAGRVGAFLAPFLFIALAATLPWTGPLLLALAVAAPVVLMILQVPFHYLLSALLRLTKPGFFRNVLFFLGADINASVNKDSNSALMEAVKNKEFDRVTALIAQGAAVHAPFPDNVWEGVGPTANSPLGRAIQDDQKVMVATMLATKPSISELDMKYLLEHSVQHSLAALNLLLGAGYFELLDHVYKEHVIEHAVARGKCEAITLILSGDRLNKEGIAKVYQFAIAYKKPEVLAYCLAQYSVDDLPTWVRPRVVNYALSAGLLHLLQLALDKWKIVPVQDNRIMLLQAVAGGHVEVVSLLLERGWKVGGRGCFDDVEVLNQWIKDERIHASKGWLNSGCTALHVAAEIGDIDMLRHLLKGSSVDVVNDQDAHNRTAFGQALLRLKEEGISRAQYVKRAQVVIMLIQAGASKKHAGDDVYWQRVFDLRDACNEGPEACIEFLTARKEEVAGDKDHYDVLLQYTFTFASKKPEVLKALIDNQDALGISDDLILARASQTVAGRRRVYDPKLHGGASPPAGGVDGGSDDPTPR